MRVWYGEGMKGQRRNFVVLCPFCGRAYALSSWRWILKAKLRGVLALGQPFSAKGKFLAADTFVERPEMLDAVTEPGLFQALKNRLLLAVRNWLGHGWLLPREVGALLPFGFYGGYPVADVGPGVVEHQVKRDKVGAVLLPAGMRAKVMKLDTGGAIW